MIQTLESQTQPILTEAAESSNVFGFGRDIQAPKVGLAPGLRLNERLAMEGTKFLKMIPAASFPIAFFDPQYRGILDKMSYGNEGKGRFIARCALPQMSEEVIANFVRLIDKALMPSGHLFLWIDKFHLCTGFSHWLAETSLEVVDLVTWDKERIGMGYRTRRKSEHLVVLQKLPKRAKGVWTSHGIPDVWHELAESWVWSEKVSRNGHIHHKPVGLQTELIRAVSNVGDVVIDPAAGSFSVMTACQEVERNFLGCDING